MYEFKPLWDIRNYKWQILEVWCVQPMVPVLHTFTPCYLLRVVYKSAVASLLCLCKTSFAQLDLARKLISLRSSQFTTLGPKQDWNINLLKNKGTSRSHFLSWGPVLSLLASLHRASSAGLASSHHANSGTAASKAMWKIQPNSLRSSVDVKWSRHHQLEHPARSSRVWIPPAALFLPTLSKPVLQGALCCQKCRCLPVPSASGGSWASASALAPRSDSPR